MQWSARAWAVYNLKSAAEAFPDVPVEVRDAREASADLSPRDRALATAIERTVLQRWQTLEYILDRFTQRPVSQARPALRATLLAGSAQLLFMDRQPAFAVLDESVEIAKQHIGGKSPGMVNAVLRKVAQLVELRTQEPWWPSRKTLPTEFGTVTLRDDILPAIDQPARHLPAVFSAPRALIRAWIDQYGIQRTHNIGLASLRTPETVAFDEHGKQHVWDDSHEALRHWLQEHPVRRVQDPASSMAVYSTRDLQPRRILDLCAGRGTKTRQLVGTHPHAHVTAYDPDDRRRPDLVELQQRLVSQPVGNGTLDVAEPTGLYDLVLLDVPCSNTGVLARRPQAKYRFTAERLASLVALQRQIIDRSADHLAPGGTLLYSTCSLDLAENHSQAEYAAQRLVGRVVRDHTELPAAPQDDQPGHDGSYHARIVSPRA